MSSRAWPIAHLTGSSHPGTRHPALCWEMLSSHLVFCLLASLSVSSPPHWGLCPTRTEVGLPGDAPDPHGRKPAPSCPRLGLSSSSLHPWPRSSYSPTPPELPQQFGQSRPPSQPEKGHHPPSAWTRPGTASSSEEAVTDAVVPTGSLPRIRWRVGRRLGSRSDFRPLRWKTDLLCHCSPGASLAAKANTVLLCLVRTSLFQAPPPSVLPLSV